MVSPVLLGLLSHGFAMGLWWAVACSHSFFLGGPEQSFLKMELYNLVAFRTFTVSCSCHLYLVMDIFITPKDNPLHDHTWVKYLK